MGIKKMKLIPFLHKPTEPPPSSSSSSWIWPNCKIPKTLSFRDETIMNSAHVAPESSFVNSSVSYSSADTIELEEDESSREGLDQSIENVIRGVKSSSERLFFDNHIGEATACILGDHHQLAKTNNKSATNGDDCVASNDSNISGSDNKAVVMEMDSMNPFEDFKKSMEEMVEASGFNVKDDWDSLHQLLSWYLNANCKSNHGYIVGAFIDLLVSLELSCASNSSFFSPTTSSSGTSSCDNDRKSSSESASATVMTEPPIPDLSLSSNRSTGPCLLTLIEEEEEDAGLDHCLTLNQEENNISETN